MSGIWVAVLVTAAGCYALKLTGLVVPQSVLGNPRVRRFAELVPIALLAALVAVQTFAAGQSLAIDPARLAGLGAAAVAAYAQRQGVDLATYTENLGPALTPEHAGKAIVDLIEAPAPAGGPEAYLLTAAGLRPVP